MTTISETIQALLPKPCPVPLLRIGGERDGAYLVPDDLEGIAACFSPGVNNFKAFEDELSTRFGIPCHMCDWTSDPARFRTPLIAGMQTFKKAWIKGQSGPDAISLADWVEETAPPFGRDLMMQMDIEGGEYESLLATDDQLLKCFRIIVLELHRLDDAESPERFERRLGPLLRKLVRHFICVHAHPNNCCGDFVLEGSGLNIPRVLEVTLLRRDRFYRQGLGQPQPPMLPHPLDLDWNVRQHPPLFLNAAWLSTPKPPESRIKELQAMLDFAQWRAKGLGQLEKTLVRMQRLWYNAAMAPATNIPVPSSVDFDVDLAVGRPYQLTSLHPASPKGTVVSRRTPFFFHTRLEPSPTITIDLGAVAVVTSIRVLNRTDLCRERARFLSYEVHSNPRPTLLEGRPLRLDLDAQPAAQPVATQVPHLLGRYVSLFTPEHTALHLAAIEIFGHLVDRASEAAIAPDTAPASRFVITKGVQGWGDRLQCFLQAVRYARHTGRTLVIDWRDTDWAHDPSEPIEHWFTLDGVDTLPLEEFLDLYRGYQQKMSVTPSAWQNCLGDPEYQRWIYRPEYHLSDDQGVIEAIVKGAPDLSETIVVYPGVGHRTFAYSDCSRIKLSPWVREQILAQACELGLCAKDYDAIHLRGGSKSWAGGRVPLKALKEKIDQTWPTQEAYLDDLYGKYQSLTAGLASRDLLILTDRRTLGEAWIGRYGCGRMIPTLNEHIAESGTHKMKAEQLADIGISKEVLIVEMLRDFCIMLNARQVVSDGVSVFSVMGERCNRAGVRLVDFAECHATAG